MNSKWSWRRDREPTRSDLSPPHQSAPHCCPLAVLSASAFCYHTVSMDLRQTWCFLVNSGYKVDVVSCSLEKTKTTKKTLVRSSQVKQNSFQLLEKISPIQQVYYRSKSYQQLLLYNIPLTVSPFLAEPWTLHLAFQAQTGWPWHLWDRRGR